jgi:hypothetical protein
MDLIKKYIDLAEAWPGTPEWKKKHDPSYNPYDPEGKMKKALKLQPYGYRGKPAESEKEETPAATPSVAKRGRPKKKVTEALSQNPSAEKTYNYAFDKVRAMDAKNPFETSNKKSMYSRAARGAFERMKTPSKKLTLPEEAEQLSELDAKPGGLVQRYLAKAAGPEGRQRRVKAAIEDPKKLERINKGIKGAERRVSTAKDKFTKSFVGPHYKQQLTPQQIAQHQDDEYKWWTRGT